MVLIRLMGAVFGPKYPRHYTGRHRAPSRFWAASVPRQREAADEPSFETTPSYESTPSFESTLPHPRELAALDEAI